MKKLHGVGVALVTPFDENGKIDFNALLNLLKHTANEGVNYYVVMGTTGESATLSGAEKSEVLQFVKDNNPNGLPIVYGVGGNNTQAILDQINNTNWDKVDAILSVSPYYNKPSQEGIYQHYKAIADTCPVPVILYNVPGRTGSNISVSTTIRLSAHKNIIAIKEASGNLEQAMEISKKKPEDFMIISGDDMLTLPLISVGAVGVISVLANPFAGIFRTIFDATGNNDYKKAQQAAFKLIDINPLMYSEGNPVGVKQTLMELDVCGNHTRLPLVSASEDLKAKIKKAIEVLR